MNKSLGFIIIVVILSLLPLGDLIPNGLPLTHDGRDHLVRIANFYTSLTEGVIVPRWGGNLNWGFGHPVMMFLYPLPSYLASLFHFLGFSIVDSLKIVFGLTYIASGVGMYLWINRLLGNYSGIVASVLYLFAPYRFVNLYVRGAIGEHVAFAFAPFVFYFITNLFLSEKLTRKNATANLIGMSVCVSLLVLSHNALSMLFIGFAVLYALVFFISFRKKRRLILTVISLCFGFVLSSFFWIPAVFEGKYTLRDIVTGNSEYATRFVTDPLKFLLHSWSYGITGQLSVQIGIVHVAIILASLFIVYKFFKKEKVLKRIYLLTLLLFLVSLFMMLKESNFIWQNLSVLQKFQFPWRFLSLTVITSSVLGGYAAYHLKEKRKAFFGFFLLILVILFLYSSFWRARDYANITDNTLKSVYYGTTDTGESSPKWSVRFMEKEAPSHIEILEGNALISEVFRSSTKHEYKIVAKERTRIKENTLYFPGWNIYVNGRKLDISEIEFQDPLNRGVMTFWVEGGNNDVVLIFEETRIRMFSSLVSIVGMIIMALLIVSLFLKKK